MTNELVPVTYDFQEIVDSIVMRNGQVFKNHYFELSRNDDNDVVVRIARFVRSEQFLTHGTEQKSYFHLFKVNEFSSVLLFNNFSRINPILQNFQRLSHQQCWI